MGKKIFLLVIVAIVYLLYARFILNPQLLRNFSLIDDGQLIKYGYYLRECLVDHRCISFKTQIIDVLPDVGLSRLGSWFLHGVLYQGPAINAPFQHSLRAFGFGLVMVLLLVLASLSAGSNIIAITLGAAVFITNYSFSENIIRLGPIEPYMVIFLGIFSLLFLNLHRLSKKWRLPAISTLFFSLIYFLLIKEASIAILPILLVVGVLFPLILNRKVLIVILIVSGGIYFLVKLLLRGTELNINYAGNYNFDPLYIFQNAGYFLSLLSNSLNPFFEFSLIFVPLVLIFKKFRQRITDFHFIYWLLVFVSFTAILFPWRYVLDRYLLPSIFSFSIFISILTSRVMGEIEKKNKFNKKSTILFRLVAVFVLFNLFFRGASLNIAKTINYRNWFAVFTQFEADQVSAIAKNKDGTVFINAEDTIDNWEIVYEIPLHLKFFYAREPKVARLETRVPSEGYLFTRSSLKPILNLETLATSPYSLIDSKTYHVSQIDPTAFRTSFESKPIQTLNNPPLLKEGFSYYWEIRKIVR